MGDIEIPKWLEGLPMAPEFRPTETEFADPIAYISKIEKQASAFGICKIIPPLPKPSKRYVLYNLNKSLSKCPELGSGSGSDSTAAFSSSSLPQTGSSSAVFTTRHQELGHSMKRFKGSVPVRQSVVHKQVWQSGEVYTLDQFESKSKIFAKNHLGNVAKDVTPLVIESLFWKAASERPIYLEYANDVPGSGFGVPEGSFQCLHKRRRKRKREFNRNQRGSVSSKKHEVSTVKESHPNTKDEVSVKNDTGGGSDMEGTAGWKLSNSPWNLQVIARSPGSLTRFMPDEVPGVTSPMVYIGMLFSWFAWHVEDHELHSMNFLHTGSPKTWYAAPGDYAFPLEEVIRVQGYGGNLDRLAALTVLGEKTTLLSPEVVVASGIPCCRLVQNPGEFVVTFPRAYHVGFSHGFNCGEAANFATPQWLKVAKEAAVRRAAMNYLPMLSHQQLLYMLTMSFVSRIPRGLLPGVRSSRLRDRKKEEREILIKKAFIEDMINENSLLHALLGKESTSYVVLWEPELLPSQNNVELLPSQNNVTQPISLSVSPEPSSALPDKIYTERIQCEPFVEKADSCIENALHDATAHVTNILSGDISSVDSQKDSSPNNKVDCRGSYMETMEHMYMDDDDDDDDFPYGLHVDSGTLACVACGVLGFPFMSIVQPSDKAAKELFPTYEVIQEALGNINFVKPPTTSHLDDTVNDSDSGTVEATGVYFEAQGGMDEHQIRKLSPKCKGQISVTEAPNFDRDIKFLENFAEEKIAFEESSPDNISSVSEVIANKEPKEANRLRPQIRASSIGVENQYPLHSTDLASPVHNLPQVPKHVPIPSTTNDVHDHVLGTVEQEFSQLGANTDNVKCAYLTDLQNVELGGCSHVEVNVAVKKDLRSKKNFSRKPCTTTEGLGSPAVKSHDNVNRWKTCNGFLRPRIFCLEHALEVEELLQCKGGANVLIICHSDYPKIKAEAMSIAEEIGVQFNCGEIPLESASQEDLNLINISIDDEDFEECGEDWTSKLGLNLQYCVKLRKLSTSKQERHALHLGGIFSDIATFSVFPSLKWQSRKSRTQTKASGPVHSKLHENAQIKDDAISGNLESGLCTDNEVDRHSRSYNSDPILAARVRKPRGRPRKQWPREPGICNENPSANDDLDSTSEKKVPDSMNLAEIPTVTKQIVESSEMVQVITCSNEKLGNDLVKLTDLSTIHVKISKTERVMPCRNEEEGIDSPKFTDICTVTIPDAEISVRGQVSPCSNEKMVVNPIAKTSAMEHVIPWSNDIIEKNSVKLGYRATVTEPLPTVTNSDAENSEIEHLVPFDNEKMGECSPKIADLPTVASPITKNSEMEQMLPCIDEKTGHGSKVSGSPTVTNTIIENSGTGQAMPCSIEKTEEIQMTLESNTMSEICYFAKSTVLPTISIPSVKCLETEPEIHITEDANTTGKICSSHNAMVIKTAHPAIVHSKPPVFIQYKRKRAVGQKMDCQYGSNGFIRGPCEGLRPRTKKVAYAVTVEEKKVIEKVTKKPYGSVVACRDNKDGGKGSHQCDIEGCRMIFMTRAELIMHKKNRCTYKGCGKRFSSHKYAMHHSRVHSDERPLKCPWKGCEMSFKWAWARTEHIRVHTGERPYQCKVIGCGLTFRFVSDFSRHRRKTGHSPSNPL